MLQNILRRTDIDHLQLVSRGVQQFVLHWLGGVLRETERLRVKQMHEAGCPGFNLAFVPLAALTYNTPVDQPSLCYACEFNTSKHCMKHGEARPLWAKERLKCFVQQRRDMIPRTTAEAVYASLWCLALWGEELEHSSPYEHRADLWALRHYTWTHVWAANVSRILKLGTTLRINTTWVSREEGDQDRCWGQLVRGKTQINNMVQAKMSASIYIWRRAMEAMHVSDAEVRPKLLKAYHSYMAAATQKEQMLVPRIFRNCDPDCRVAVQRSFEANTRIPCLRVDDEVVIQESALHQFFTVGVDKPLMKEFLDKLKEIYIYLEV